jgi:hypothetical protein
MASEPPLEHAWRYFALHAEQRITVFNYFVALASLIATGLAVATNLPPSNWYLGATCGILLAALSFVFWKLDQRGSQFVKLAEDALVEAETDSNFPANQRVVSLERALENKSLHPTKPWTFGRAFRLLFIGMALVGLVGAGSSIYRGWNWVAPAVATKERAQDPPAVAKKTGPAEVAALPAPSASNSSNLSANPTRPTPVSSASGKSRHPSN